MRTIEAADKIIVLSQGKVIEQGRPEDLYQDKNSTFRRMSDLQSESAHWSIKK